MFLAYIFPWVGSICTFPPTIDNDNKI